VESLYDAGHLPLAHAVFQALQAHGLYGRDVEYIVEDDEVHIVDEHTGRVSPDKRYSNGLHQAIECKEGVPLRSETLTLAKTSYQFFFRGYPGLCGMTGTAWSARDELRQVYHREVVRVPPHRPMIREDHPRVVYRTLDEKRDAVVAEIVAARAQGRPVLVGTVSVEESEAVSAGLAARHIPHETLNARHHGREARIVAQAGRAGAVTISTNMAGRGTDIMLGGNPQILAMDTADHGAVQDPTALARLRAAFDEDHARVVAAGGLLVIGTGEHESRRIDQQLRGRAGRQGDPGSSIFIVSTEDPVYRRFGQKHALPALMARLAEHLATRLFEMYLARPGMETGAEWIELDRKMLLEIIDGLWPQFLNDMEGEEEGIWLRSFAQRDPLVEFRQLAARMYGQLMRDIEVTAVRAWMAPRRPRHPTVPADRIPASSPQPVQHRVARR
jgi:preprotein translocase subunit SecA